MILPVDFHCHGVGEFDFAKPCEIDLVMIDALLGKEGIQTVLVLSLPEGELTSLETLMSEFHAKASNNTIKNILGIGLEGPLLSLVGGTPEAGCWCPTREQWERIARLGEYGLVYSVISPDAVIPEGAEYPPDVLSVARILARRGVMPALGHFSKSDPGHTANLIDELCSTLWSEGLGPIVTDHLFNDMPLNFKHSWRTQRERAHKADELGRVLATSWESAYLKDAVGPVPAALVEQAMKGRLKICLNFDGDHVDIEVCKKAVEVIGSENILLMTDRIPGRTFGGRKLEVHSENTLLYQADGIVAGGTQSVLSQIGNMIQVGMPSDAIRDIAFTNAHAVLDARRPASA